MSLEIGVIRSHPRIRPQNDRQTDFNKKTNSSSHDGFFEIEEARIAESVEQEPIEVSVQ